MILLESKISASFHFLLERFEYGCIFCIVRVLHTWGRNLAYHPHVHYLVPAGAYDGLVWRYGRYQRFLLPVRALSLLFRAKFRDALKQADCFADVSPSVWSQDWVVHCQPVGRGQRALRYLAPYIFRVAISNNRIVSLTNGAVTFRYRPSGSPQWRLSTVTAMEFIRRFLQQVLPKGFVKVRYYGFFSPGQRRCLGQIMALLIPPESARTAKTRDDPEAMATAEAPPRCPQCGFPLRRTQTLPTRKRRWQPP